MRIMWVLVVCLVLAACNGTAPPPEEELISVKAVVNAITSSLTRAQANNVPGFPPLQKATATLQTAVGRVNDGSLSLGVITFGGKKSSESATTLKLDLKPPLETDAGSLSSAQEDLEDALAKAINKAKAAWLDAKNDDDLVASSIQVEVRFLVKREKGTGVGTGDLLTPIGLNYGSNASIAETHSVALVFGSSN